MPEPVAPPPRPPMPPPLVIPPKGLWRDTPPAIFAPILGLLGLGLLLRALAPAVGLGMLADLAEGVLGGAVLLHAFALVAYAAKPLRRPAALAEDLRALPGRAGVAAALAAIHLSAAALVPLAPGLAVAMVLGGLALQAAFMTLVLWLFARMPPEGRAVNAVFHLTFVGHILAIFALVPLGWTGLAGALFWLGLATAGMIWAVSLPRAPRVPAPLRPTLAIHLAPASVLTSGAALLGLEGVVTVLALWALLLAALLAARLRWVLAAGFSPFWGALTFPLAAFGQGLLRGLGEPGLWLASGMAVVTAGFIPWVVWRVLKLWPGGTLARRTNAAVA
jgi:tellurite resistance protein